MADYDQPGSVNGDLPQPLNWHDLFAQPIQDEDWLVDDIWPAGRAISVVAGVKQGKSTLLFYLAACLAQGVDPWTRRPREPVTVGYWDMEMTEDDVHDRAIDFGLTPDQLDRFRYYLLPSVPPLDTPEGGRAVLDTLRRDQVQATVFDTIGRVLEGEENDAHTINAYYRNTALHLKAEGIASARLDHVGHTNTERARGSSGKGADVDVAWVLKRGDDNTVTLDHHLVTRVRWVQQRVDLVLVEGDPDRYARTSFVWPAGTKECAELLDRLDVPVDWGRGKAREAIRDSGEEGARNDVLSAAIRFRRDRDDPLKTCPQHSGTVTNVTPGDRSGTDNGKPSMTSPGQVGDSPGQVHGPSGDRPPYLVGDRSPGLPPKPDEMPF